MRGHRTAFLFVARFDDQSLGLGVWDLRSGTWDLGFGIWNLGCGVWDVGLRFQGLRLGIYVGCLGMA